MTASLPDSRPRAPQPFGPELTLIGESRICDLIPTAGHRVLEASGVLVEGDQLYVIFDNTPDIAVLDADLGRTTGNRLILQRRRRTTGYEDIARDPITGDHFILIESLARDDGFRARVEQFDPDFVLRGGRWVDVPLPSANKGLEGLTCLRRAGETFLLALCEGNYCRSGRAGRAPGGGRIFVLRRGRHHWHRVDTIRLPGSLRFVDYSSVSIRDGRLAVASQESSAVWVGRLRPDRWQIADAGTTYAFPRSPSGDVLYGCVEGISWLSGHRLAVVSDRANRRARRRTGEHRGGGRSRQQGLCGPPGRAVKEQMVHLFDLPECDLPEPTVP
jgi:hypothetical protein